MFIQSNAAAIKHGTPQPKTYYAPLIKDSSSAHLSRHSCDELTIALLDPCLTLEEAALQARMRQNHSRD